MIELCFKAANSISFCTFCASSLNWTWNERAANVPSDFGALLLLCCTDAATTTLVPINLRSRDFRSSEQRVITYQPNVVLVDDVVVVTVVATVVEQISGSAILEGQSRIVNNEEVPFGFGNKIVCLCADAAAALVMVMMTHTLLLDVP